MTPELADLRDTCWLHVLSNRTRGVTLFRAMLYTGQIQWFVDGSTLAVFVIDLGDSSLTQGIQLDDASQAEEAKLKFLDLLIKDANYFTETFAAKLGSEDKLTVFKSFRKITVDYALAISSL